MKINNQVLSIPPYISTAWENVASLHVESHNGKLLLMLSLINGQLIEVPGLHPGLIKAIFAAHANFLEVDHQKRSTPSVSAEQIFTFGFPFGQPGLEMNAPTLEHNPQLADTPDLPPSLLKKIAELSSKLGMKTSTFIPEPEPHCNCMHCQIAKAMQNGLNEELESEEEIVSDEDLKFRIWDIQQAGDNLYTVSNPEDAQEKYNVYLGEPVGCTCGNPHCEHIRAVLSS
jgi:hypothetical protein